MPKDYDFAGWVTKNDIMCADGVIIKHNAFLDDNDRKVPLVWQHGHDNPDNVLGHMLLENRDSGVYGYGYFNENTMAQSARESVKHGDITAMSIFATKIKKQGRNVVHGRIREVSLVLSGANPGATIEHVNLRHDDMGEEFEEFVLYPGFNSLIHSDDDNIDEGGNDVDLDEMMDETIEHAEGKTIGDVMDTMSDEQQDAVAALIANLITNGVGDPSLAQSEYDEEENTLKHNVFDNQGNEVVLRHGEVLTDNGEVLSQSDIVGIINDTYKASGNLRDAFVEHGITNIETLFPEANQVNNEPIWYKDQNTNAQAIVNAIRKSPFSRIKSRYADLTEKEARARGYIKGSEKKEQFFSIAGRETTPQTVYKKQKLDRDDIVDITDFNVVSWMNTEMRFMLIEELARAAMIGDGREIDDPDKIKEDKIRPIISDNDLYTLKATYTGAEDLVENVIKAKKEYRGSGQPYLYLTPTLMADLKLLKDGMGRFLYDTPAQIAAKMGIAGFVETSLFDEVDPYAAVLVNLSDYTFGSTRGGEVTTFDDFDIDFNQMKYLIETRLCGALTTPHSAIAFTKVASETPKA